MTGRGAAIQGALAVAALLAAYAAWQREPAPNAQEVLVVDATKNDLESVRYEDDGKWTELLRRADADGPAVWLRISARQPPAPPTPKAPDGAAPPPPPRAEPGTPEREVRASESGAKAWEKFAPFRAARQLGVLDAGKLKELGLESAKRHLTVKTRAAAHAFTLGSPAPGGETYMRRDNDGMVFLLSRQAASDLDATGVRFIDRTLHAFKMSDVKRVQVAGTTGSEPAKRAFVVLAPESASPRLAQESDPAKPDDLASNWHEKIWRLFPNDVLGRDEVPTAGQPTSRVRVQYDLKAGAPGYLELATVEPAASASATGPGTVEVFARSEHTAGWVKLPASVNDLIGEAAKVAGHR